MHIFGTFFLIKMHIFHETMLRHKFEKVFHIENLLKWIENNVMNYLKP